MSYSNADILAAVVSEWCRPAISQIASDKIARMQFMQQLERGLMQSGIVGANYHVVNDLQPFMQPAINNLLQPMLARYFSQIPDETIPRLAHEVVDKAMTQPKFSVLDGFIEFDQNDLIELQDLLDKNLPVEATQGYQVIH